MSSPSCRRTSLASSTMKTQRIVVIGVFALMLAGVCAEVTPLGVDVPAEADAAELLEQFDAAFALATTVDEAQAVFSEWADRYDEVTAGVTAMSRESVIDRIGAMLLRDDEVFVRAMGRKGEHKPLSVVTEGKGQPTLATFRVLDAACGTGLLGALAKERMQFMLPPVLDMHFAGVDLNEAMLRVARGRGIYDRDSLKRGDLRGQLPFADGEFDMVISAGAFGVNGCGLKCIPEIMRVVRPGGVLITTVEHQLLGDVEEELHAICEDSSSAIVEAVTLPYREETHAVVLTLQKEGHDLEAEL